MEKQRKEIQVIVEGAQPNYFELIPILKESQEMAFNKFGGVALAVYRLPNRFYDGTAPEA
jgi:hypothetical protein